MGGRGRLKKSETRRKRENVKAHPMTRRSGHVPNSVFDEVASQSVSPVQLHPQTVDANFQIKIEHDENKSLSGGTEQVATTLTFGDSRKALAEVASNKGGHGEEPRPISLPNFDFGPKNVAIPAHFDFLKTSSKASTGTGSTQNSSPTADIAIKLEKMSPSKNWIQIVSVATAPVAMDTTEGNRVEEPTVGIETLTLDNKMKTHGPLPKKPRLSNSFHAQASPVVSLKTASSSPVVSLKTASPEPSRHWEPVKRKITTTPFSVRFFECPKCCQEFEDRVSAEIHFSKCDKTFNFNGLQQSKFMV